MSPLGRRPALAAIASGLASLWVAPRSAHAFGEEGAFHPRILLTGTARWEGTPRRSGPARWSFELARRTSAPAKSSPATVRADSGSLLAEPFVIWTGDGPIAPLSSREIEMVRKFITSGGTMLVDDAAPETGAFGRDAKRELARVLPDSVVTTLPDTHVIFHSFYRLKRAVGRVEGPRTLDAISRAGNASVIFSSHDLLGALARDVAGPSFSVIPGGDTQRELATRLAVNLAMYVLCSTYKDDQVHAPALMKRSLLDRLFRCHPTLPSHSGHLLISRRRSWRQRSHSRSSVCRCSSSSYGFDAPIAR